MAWELNTFFYINKKCMGAHGFGKFIGLDGTIYIGNWENDKQKEVAEKFTLMAPITWGNSLMGKKAEKENSHSQRGTHMKGIFMIMK